MTKHVGAPGSSDHDDNQVTVQQGWKAKAARMLGFGRDGEAAQATPESGVMTRRDILLGRRVPTPESTTAETAGSVHNALSAPANSREQALNIPPALSAALSGYLALSGVAYVLKAVDGGFAVDLDKSKVVDQQKADTMIMKAGAGENIAGLFPWLWEHAGAGMVGLIIGAWIGNKFIRSPKASEKAEAVAERDQQVARLTPKLAKVGLFGNAPGQLSESKLKQPNMGPKAFAEHFRKFDITPETVLSMLDACVESLQAVQQEVTDGGTASIPAKNLAELRAIFSAYNIDKAGFALNTIIQPVAIAHPPGTPAATPPLPHAPTPDQIADLIREIEFIRDNPTHPATVTYITERVKEVKKAATDAQIGLDIAAIEEANQKISKEVPFFTAAGQAISGTGETSRREFLKHVGIPAALVGLASWGILDPPVFGSTKADDAAKKAKEAREKAAKAAEDITDKYKAPVTPGGKKGMEDAVRGGSGTGGTPEKAPKTEQAPEQHEEGKPDDEKPATPPAPSKEDFIKSDW